MIHEDNVIVRLAPLPNGVRGTVSLSPDGYYNIYLNQNLTYTQQQETLEHELDHIKRNDLARDVALSAIEAM